MKIGVTCARAHISDQFNRLAIDGKTDGDVGINYILDFYRRYCEMCYDFLNSIYVINQYASGIKKPKRSLRYVELINNFKKDTYTAILVNYLEPYIRHTESHLTTKIEYEKGKKGNVILLDTRGKKK